jgi:peptidoglycan/LPS O-acetylase OafA/YrhL
MQPVRTTWSGALLTALFLALAVVVFLLLYLSFTNDQHYTALILIGIVSLIFALGSYLAESLSRSPSYQRSLAWGFFGMGFSVLFLTVGLGPYYNITTTIEALEGLLVLLVVLIITVALIAWRVRAVRATENQQVPRAGWRSETAPSAFSYAAANSPSVPTTAPPPSPPPSNPPRSP